MTANLSPQPPSPAANSSILPVASSHITDVKTPSPPPLPPVRGSSINRAIPKSSSLAVLSPSAFASPLLSGHGQRLLGRGSRRTSTPLESAKSQGIDFGKPLGRQASFINAMVLAEETEENVEAYESCIGEKSTPKKNMVTFNSSVEEFSASSLASGSSVGGEKKCELAWPESPVKPVVGSDDLYCDDDELFSPHMQLVGRSSLVELEGDEKNSAEATTQTEDSSFLSGGESFLKKSSPGDGSVDHVAANCKEGDDSPESNFLTGQLQQLSGEQEEEVNAEGEHLGEEGEGGKIVANRQESYTGKGSCDENLGEVCAEEDDFESSRVEVEGGSQQGEDMETCVDGSHTEKDHCEEWSGQEDDGELHHLEIGSESHAEKMESCLDGSYTEKAECDSCGVQEMATGSSDRNDEEGIGDNSILQPLNWPEENTEAIGGTALLEMENEAGDLFESYAASMGGRSEEEKLAAEESNEGELRSSIHIEPKSATEDGDLFQSYPATILEGMEQIGDNEEEEEGKALAEGVLWLVGDRCVARWEEEQGGDGLWYRAQVCVGLWV